MKRPEVLAARDINSRAEKHRSLTIPESTGNPILDANLFDLAQRYCGTHNPTTVLQMLATVMNATASPQLERHDLEIMNRTIDELFAADRMFAPYRNIRKVTCFGSARIKEDDPSYKLAQEFSRLAVEHGYMVITGGGPGIMQACNEGAHAAHSFGLNITLPYEQKPNHVVEHSDKMMNFHYFFTRKLNFLKQSDALVAFPGGFGTMDEIFETITLMQTGKSTLFPIVLLDPPYETFWGRWIRFIEKELLDAGLISPEDMRLLYPCKSAESAFACIERFYSRFHSYYFSKDDVVIRIMEPLSDKLMDWIRHDFSDIMPKDDLTQEPGYERDPDPALATLPRLRFTFRKGAYNRLRELIDVVNDR